MQKGGKTLFRVIPVVSFFIVIVLGLLVPLLSSSNHYLIGPDTYYNMRTCEQTLASGQYPLNVDDHLLNYPVFHKGARPPLFNMIAVSLSTLIGLNNSMMILPVIYGAISTILLYYVSKEFFDKSVAMISSLVYSLTPVVTSFTVSYIGRFDHDSFVIMILLAIILFLVRSLKNTGILAYMYSILTGVFIGVIFVSWVASQIYFFTIIIFLVLRLIYVSWNNIFYDDTFSKLAISFLVAYLITIPYSLIIGVINYLSLSLIVVISLFVFHYFVSHYEINRRILFPLIVISIFSILLAMYLLYINGVNVYLLYDISNVLFGSGAYHSKIFSTISEGGIVSLSEMIIRVGVITFWLSFVGFYIYLRSDSTTNNKLMIMTLFFIAMWLVTQAGRFIPLLLITMIPLAVVVVTRILTFIVNYIRLRCLDTVTQRRHVIKLSTFLIIITILVSSSLILQVGVVTSYQSLNQYDYDFEKRWIDVSEWFAQQDTNLTPENRPAILGWWDYGFILASVGKHPVVADNYQSGIYPASQYFTATSEKEILSVIIVRILEGIKECSDEDCKSPIGKLPDNVKSILFVYTFNSSLAHIIENPIKYAPSYNKSIGNTSMKVTAFNAMYIDSVKILSSIPLYRINNLYLDLVNVTGYKVGYLVLSKRDVDELFPVITYLSDKGYWIVTYNDSYYSGYDMTKKDRYYQSMGYKLFYKRYQLRYFDIVYNADDVIVYKYINR